MSATWDVPYDLFTTTMLSPNITISTSIIRPTEYWGYRSYGPNPSTDCGLTIRNASRLDNGLWSITPDNINAIVNVKGDYV